MKSGHILIVDDDVKVRTLLRRCFEGEGFTVSEAKDGAELHACLGRNPVSLITLDLNLGKENGLDLARDPKMDADTPYRIKRTLEKGSVPIDPSEFFL